MLKLIQNGKAAVAVLATFTGTFLSDLCLCAKACVRGANRVCLCRASYTVSVTRHACACVLVCVFLWFKSQDSTTTEPE